MLTSFTYGEGGEGVKYLNVLCWLIYFYFCELVLRMLNVYIACVRGIEGRLLNIKMLDVG